MVVWIQKDLSLIVSILEKLPCFFLTQYDLSWVVLNPEKLSDVF